MLLRAVEASGVVTVNVVAMTVITSPVEVRISVLDCVILFMIQFVN